MKRAANRYAAIIAKIFESHFSVGMTEFAFDRSEIEAVAAELAIKLPKNLGDVIYSFKYRESLPESIQKTATGGMGWLIRSVGRARYQFALVQVSRILPNENLARTKILDSTPGIIAAYALSDEQALLAKVRYNRLLDIFTGVTCYSLQNHLRTTAPGVGQVEVDEIYVGVDRHGAHHVFPIQAKGGRDQLNIVQIEQDLAVCAERFGRLICRPIAAQFLNPALIAMFELGIEDQRLVIVAERHYQLVPPTELSPDELLAYRNKATSS